MALIGEDVLHFVGAGSDVALRIEIVAVETRARHHGQHFAGVAVEHHHRAGELSHDGLFNLALQLAVERGVDRHRRLRLGFGDRAHQRAGRRDHVQISALFPRQILLAPLLQSAHPDQLVAGVSERNVIRFRFRRRLLDVPHHVRCDAAAEIVAPRRHPHGDAVDMAERVKRATVPDVRLVDIPDGKIPIRMVEIVHRADQFLGLVHHLREAPEHRLFVGDLPGNDADLHRVAFGGQRQSVAVVNVSARGRIPMHDQLAAVLQLRQDRLPVPGNFPRAALVLQQHARLFGDVPHQDGVQRYFEQDGGIRRCQLHRKDPVSERSNGGRVMDVLVGLAELILRHAVLGQLSEQGIHLRVVFRLPAVEELPRRGFGGGRMGDIQADGRLGAGGRTQPSAARMKEQRPDDEDPDREDRKNSNDRDDFFQNAALLRASSARGKITPPNPHAPPARQLSGSGRSGWYPARSRRSYTRHRGRPTTLV